ncbi:MAG: DUF2236 domain-containing protein [Anaerolineae bacterium]|jgi:uncharacterized protein (DUF2236 family)|nr:DUF2236 domain-containing protein [Anaerolineae bacterium]
MSENTPASFDHEDTSAGPYHFAPDSAIWRINREQVLLLTGARVLLMQIAHPLVAAAVYEHSYVFRQPVRRLLRTLRLTLTLIFGTRPEVSAALAAIDRAHRPATGRLRQAAGRHAAGAAYNPRQPRPAFWVQATLVEGAITGYERLVGPLSHADKEAFYQQSKTIGAWMGIPPARMPAGVDDLYATMHAMIASGEVCVSDQARAIAPFLTGQSLPLLRYAAYPAFRLTVALLPEPLRAQYGYDLSPAGQRRVDWFCRGVQKVVPALPPLLRYMPAYRRALSRR